MYTTGMRTINREIVGVHIYSKDGKLLIAKGTERGVYPGTWKIPGGGVDDGETHEQTLMREVKEETGIDATGRPVELVDDNMTGEGEKTLQTGERVTAKMKFYTYKIVLDQNASEVKVVLDPDEFSEYTWVDIKDLKSINLSPPSVELFTRLGFI